MAASITGKVLALVGRPASSVLWSVGNLSDWQTLASEKSIAVIADLPRLCGDEHYRCFLRFWRSTDRRSDLFARRECRDLRVRRRDLAILRPSAPNLDQPRDDAGAAPHVFERDRLRDHRRPHGLAYSAVRGAALPGPVSLGGLGRAQCAEVRTGALLRDIIWRWCLRRPFERDVRKRRSGGDFQRFVDTTSGCTERYRDGRIFRERPCRRTRVERLGADRLHTGRQPTPMATVAGGQGADPVRLVELSTDRKSSSPVDLSTTILAHENQFHAGGIGPFENSR